MLTPFKPGAINIKEASRLAKQSAAQPSYPVEHFIRAGEEYTTPERSVPAPYFRRAFTVREDLRSAVLTVGALGLYEARCNGEDFTKGPLAPYRANPDHRVYFDEYDLTDRLRPGKNALAFTVGVGLQSSVHPKWKWRFLPWRGAVQLAFSLELTYENGETEMVVSDGETKTAPSPIVFNDYHLGEYYDARLETDGWDAPDFDDGTWRAAIPAPKPGGTACCCEAEPIAFFETLAPVSVTPFEDGWIYDFGVNCAGVCRLTVRGERGQKIVLRHFERMHDGEPFWKRISVPGLRLQEDEYICRGEGAETWQPRFTYHGFRYALVTGITAAQATKDLLRFRVMHSDLPMTGCFSCDNDTVNKLQAAALCSDLSCFFYFPTDCPQREKHGWTGDARLSAEQMAYNFDPTRSWREWLRNIYCAMTPEGALPGIVPTGGVTYDWGNGPAWDGVIAELPYQAYRFYGDRRIAAEACVPLMRWLTYLTTRRREDGLIGFGLGDWCDVGAKEVWCRTPQLLTDTVVAVDVARKAALLFDVSGRPLFRRFAEELADDLLTAARRELIDHARLLAYGETQTAQAMALYYGIFTPGEFGGAFENLLAMIHDEDDHFSTGVLGARVIFRLLAEHGQAELALRMIVREDAPSYGSLIARGATSLWEEFDGGDPPRGDENHHFWGDVSAWFYRYLAGVRQNPTARDVNETDVAPCFPVGVNAVTASCCGVSVDWKRSGDEIAFTLTVAEGKHGEFRLPDGWRFDGGERTMPLASGKYRVVRNLAE
ncbi:MAG: family 78 glycoside hydrolase catalytic domain [Oscillospiraceae bacterium]|nr:family 78 glycoside hydrolase catalytic domain [Oscillospiraceae bacterium]